MNDYLLVIKWSIYVDVKSLWKSSYTKYGENVYLVRAENLEDAKCKLHRYYVNSFPDSTIEWIKSNTIE